MRIHITLDDELVAELDRHADSQGRNAFVAELNARGLEDERRWNEIESVMGGLPDTGHEWDDDPGEWVRRQRRGDARRSG